MRKDFTARKIDSGIYLIRNFDRADGEQTVIIHKDFYEENFMEEKNYCAMLLVDDIWQEAFLSDKDIQRIQDDLNGLWGSQYLVTLANGEVVDVGIVDNIKIKSIA